MPSRSSRRLPSPVTLFALAATFALMGCAAPSANTTKTSPTAAEALETLCKLDAGLHVRKKVVLPPLELGGFSTVSAVPFQLRPEDRFVFETSHIELEDDDGNDLSITRTAEKIWDSLTWELIASSVRYCHVNEGAASPCCPEGATQTLRDAVFTHAPVKSVF